MSALIPSALLLVFLFVGSVPIGAVLLLGVARVTGADWSPLARIAAAMPAVAALALSLGLVVIRADIPAHLQSWQAPALVTVRGVAACLALAWLGARLADGRASVTVAGVALALYAWLVTPIASDWLLAGVPGHSVSAVGMMLATQQIAAACAVVLVTGWGGERQRSDLAKLLVAAALGLCYLTYMDYLIIWFGNLPERVPFYLARGGAGALAIAVALLLGLAVPVALLSLRPGEAGRRPAGASALAGLFVFDAWWIGAGVAAALLSLAGPAIVWGWWRWRGREAAGG